jgi:hypothetical protein
MTVGISGTANYKLPMSFGVSRLLPRRVSYRQVLVVLALCLGACERPKPTKELRGARVQAACAMCIFKMEGVRAWCNMPRQALVDGELLGGRFVASRFELLPATNVPEKPRFSEEHVH